MRLITLLLSEWSTWCIEGKAPKINSPSPSGSPTRRSFSVHIRKLAAFPGDTESLLKVALGASIFGLLLELGAAAPAAGLVIYRWGGDSMPPPPEVEAGDGQVRFLQRAWSDLDQARGGGISQLAIDDQAIAALRLDPQQNLAIAAKNEGGVYQGDKFDRVFDGDLNTVWLAEQYVCANTNRSYQCDFIYSRAGTIQIDLKGQFLVDRILVVSGLDDPAAIARNFAIHVADEVPLLTYVRPNPFKPFIVEISDNRQQFREVRIPSRGPVGFVQVAIAEHNEDWQVHDIQVFGRGFVERSTYQSDIIDMGRPMSWGQLRWSGRQDGQAKVLIQTRSGRDEDPDIFWRSTGRGQEKVAVSRSAYDQLKLGEKAGTSPDQENWSFWSAPYSFADSSGTPVVSASPRRYFQFKVDFLSQDEAGGQVEVLELRASEPVASNLVGEIWPVEAPVGQSAAFTYVLRPTLGPNDAGFDRLEIATSSILGAVEAVRIGDRAVPFTVEIQEEHRLVVRFARLGPADSGALVEVDFSAQVLRYGATFDGRVSDSAKPLEVPQGVNGGDASSAYEGNRVAVATAVAERGFLQARVEPAVFTPNGDGVNDGVRICYAVLEITGVAQVGVEVWDLSGRRVVEVYSGAVGIGEYEQEWGWEGRARCAGAGGDLSVSGGDRRRSGQDRAYRPPPRRLLRA